MCILQNTRQTKTGQFENMFYKMRKYYYKVKQLNIKKLRNIMTQLLRFRKGYVWMQFKFKIYIFGDSL